MAVTVAVTPDVAPADGWASAAPGRAASSAVVGAVAGYWVVATGSTTATRSRSVEAAVSAKTRWVVNPPTDCPLVVLISCTRTGYTPEGAFPHWLPPVGRSMPNWPAGAVNPWPT